MKQCIKTNGVLFFFCLISLIITAQEQSVQSNIKCLNYCFGILKEKLYILM